MPFCNKCGKQVGEGQVFCTGCGGKLPAVGPGAEPAAPVPAPTPVHAAPAAVPAATAPAPPKRRRWLAVVLVAVLLLLVLAAGGAAAWFMLGPGGSGSASQSISADDLGSLGFDTVPGEQMGSGTGSQDATVPAEEPATP